MTVLGYGFFFVDLHVFHSQKNKEFLQKTLTVLEYDMCVVKLNIKINLERLK